MQYNPPKGTRDFYPSDMALQNMLFTAWRETALRFGFEEYEGPMFEHLEVFTRKSGDEIVKQLYNFKDKSDRELALRPEITPTLARMVASKGRELRKPVKWFSIPRLFRYERMQRGRLREFFQYNLDIMGEPSVSAEAEIVAAAVSLIESFGAKKSEFRVRVNSRRLMRALLLAIPISEERLDKAYGVLDRRAKTDAEGLKQLYADAGFSESERDSIESIFSIKTLAEIGEKWGNNEEVAASLADLHKFFSLVNAYGIIECVIYDPAIVRGLAYYTGIVFEIHDTAGELRAMAGGGRYDNLIGLFGGEPTPAVGFGMGDAVITEFLKDRGMIPQYKKECDAFIVTFEKDNMTPSIQMATLLRSKGFSVEFSLKQANFKKQMEAAQNAKFAVFVGGEEWERGEVKIKNMKSGEEKLVGKLSDELIQILSGK
ncbi:MAG: histidine--tRNA ligase [Fibrobacteres bacterium]|nr:histidine--tRNA ligase [Fibrobacterota bacterium]